MTDSELLAARIARILEEVERRGVPLGPPLGEERVAAFEARHGITLPDTYRAFVSEVGNGGEGPAFCGMTGLGEAAGDMYDVKYWESLPRVRDPFPFTKTWIWDIGQETDEGTRDDIRSGSLCVGNDGCGAYWHLIVTGPERGKVWMISPSQGIQPMSPNRDYLQWYEDWFAGVREWWDFNVQ